METIGLIAAMPQEVRPLLQRAGKRARTRLGSFACYRFRLAGRDCLLVESGMGLRHAMDATRALLGAAKLQLLLSFGVAGAVQDDLRVGDVVYAGRTCRLEQGLPGRLEILASLSEAARQAAAQALEGRAARLVPGTAITTPGSQTVRLPPEGMAHPVLEMETAGIAQVAAQMGIPLLALRAVSDGPAEPLPFDIEAFTDGQLRLRLGKFITTILRHPGILPQFLRLGRNTEKAAQNLAAVLVAVLSQPDPLVST